MATRKPFLSCTLPDPLFVEGEQPSFRHDEAKALFDAEGISPHLPAIDETIEL